MAKFITTCSGDCGSTTGNVLEEELLHLINGGPLNKSPFLKIDREQLQTLRCARCGAGLEVTLTSDAAEWMPRRY